MRSELNRPAGFRKESRASLLGSTRISRCHEDFCDKRSLSGRLSALSARAQENLCDAEVTPFLAQTLRLSLLGSDLGLQPFPVRTPKRTLFEQFSLLRLT